MASLEKEFWRFLTHVRIPLTIVLLMWLAHLLNESKGGIYNSWGIYPRELDGLVGIFLAPVLHSGYQHLFSNSIPMFVLTSIMVIFYRRVAVPSFVFIYLLAGATVWMFGREVYHIGASGVVYGLVSFVFWLGVFRKNSRSIVLSLIIIVMYSGYISGVLPDQPGISWESHLLGGLVGILVAFLFKDVLEPDEIVNEAVVEETQEYFLPRDIFEKTKEQRRIEAEMERRRQMGGWETDNTNEY